MKIATFSTVWGSSTGGIDVVNTNLIKGLISLNRPIEICACFLAHSEALEKESKKLGFKFVTPTRNPSRKEDGIVLDGWTYPYANSVFSDMLFDQKFMPDIILLHDIFCKEIIPVARRLAPNAQIITLFHSAYGRSEKRKGRDDSEIETKKQFQREMLEESDIAIAVGTFSEPYLKSLVNSTEAQKVVSLVPGRPEMKSCAHQQSHFSAISFGRLDAKTDTIKKIKLSAQGWAKAWRSGEIRKLTTDDAVFYAVGGTAEKSVLDDVKAEFFNTWRANIVELPFESSEDFEKSDLKKNLNRSAFALLNSWYENFGLTYLEACTFGIPTIVSESSGFYHDLKSVIGADKVSELLNTLQLEELSDEEIVDKINVKLIALSQAYDDTFSRASLLRGEILLKWPTWTAVADKLVGICKVDEKVRTVSDGSSEPPDEPSASKTTPPWPEILLDLKKWCWRDNTDYFKRHVESKAEKGSEEHYLTPMQKVFWDRRDELASHPFKDLVVSGGTSSGKTTLAEYLFGSARPFEFERSRILYIAPTKALAQERATAWRRAFPATNPRDLSREPVIVSTGDDNAADGALLRGDFNIAATVYEKANVILNTSGKLLQSLNMVVIDEFHMIEDLHRGPVIEALLTKVKLEKARRFSGEFQGNPLRIVVLTTEHPGGALVDFLTFDDYEIDSRIVPMIVSDASRAREVNHKAILPGFSPGPRPAIFEIAKFGVSDKLQISSEERSDLKERFYSFRQALSYLDERVGYDPRRQKSEYHWNFIESWMLANSMGGRLLVFLNSKGEMVEFARFIKNKIAKNFQYTSGPSPTELAVNEISIKKLVTEMEGVESTEFIQDLKRCAEQGVFLHNADVPRSVRAALEQYLASKVPENARSEIVLATETLSYGVNLQVSDVALLNVLFPDNERMPTPKPPQRLISRCDFVNMAGRAGRLGQDRASGPATVYWYLDPEAEGSFDSVLNQFYKPGAGVRSQLLYKSDIGQLSRLIKVNKQAALIGDIGASRTTAIEQLSYPFTRAVLDSVRFLGGTEGAVGFLGRAGCDIKDVVATFFLETLYAKQIESDSALKISSGAMNVVNVPPPLSGLAPADDYGDERQKMHLIEAVKQVVVSASLDDYDLVRRLSTGAFQITELGNATIDTGTEVQTVINLRQSILALKNSWSNYLSEQVPFEVVVLAAFFQPEVNRQFIARLPEFKLPIDWNAAANREDLVSRIVNGFIESGVLDPSDFQSARSSIHEYVRWTITNQKLLTAPFKYPEGEYDSCLRLFVAFQAWMMGKSLKSVMAEVQRVYAGAGKTPETSVFNFESFAENLTWKIMFLVSLVRASGNAITSPNAAFGAARFINRARLGCRDDVVPLLFRGKIQGAPMNRVEAHTIVDLGFSCAGIALGKFDGSSPIGAIRERAVREHVRKFIFESFQELSRQFCFLASGTGLGLRNEDITRQYWDFALRKIRSLVDTASTSEFGWDESALLADVFIEQSTDQAYSTIVATQYGVQVQTFQMQFSSEESDSIDLALTNTVAAVFCFDSQTTIPSQDEMKSSAILLVDFPWAMGIVQAYEGYVRISPAAFGVMLSLIARDFVSDVDRFLEAILKSGSERVGTRELYLISHPHLKKGSFPEALFDAWAKYLEIGDYAL
jgi:glycosyltransferase involved in cell wall biosynthesis